MKSASQQQHSSPYRQAPSHSALATAAPRLGGKAARDGRCRRHKALARDSSAWETRRQQVHLHEA